MTRVVLASGNDGKLRELAALLAPFSLQLEAQSDFGIRPAAETGTTFVENALLKAHHAARHARHATCDAPPSGSRSRDIVRRMRVRPWFIFAHGAGAPSTSPWMRRWPWR